jgi:hypothetical protein
MSGARTSGQRPQRRAQFVRATPRNQSIDFGMGPRPQRKRFGKQRAAGRGDYQMTAAFILLVDRNLHQSAAFKWFEGRGERRAVHGKQRRNTTDVWRFRPVQRHQQGELPMREFERAEHLIEAPCQRARRSLHMQAQAGIAYLACRGKRQFMTG